jgi:hypothetical protein
MQRRHWRLYAKPQSSTSPAEWWPDDTFISAPDDVAMLRPFTVHRYENPLVAGKILRRLCAMLLLATVVFIVLIVAAGHGNVNAGFFAGALVCGLCLLTVLMWTWWSTSRLVVDPRGVHVTQGLKTRSIPWDQLEDVTIDRDVKRESELAFHTPTGKVLSTATDRLDTPDGHLLAQLATTILYYRRRFHAGTAQWEVAVGDDEADTGDTDSRS